MVEQKRTVIHLELQGKHYYYGSIKALCEHHGKDEIGVGYNYLSNFCLSPTNPFNGKLCTIRKGFLVTTPKSKNSHTEH